MNNSQSEHTAEFQVVFLEKAPACRPDKGFSSTAASSWCRLSKKRKKYQRSDIVSVALGPLVTARQDGLGGAIRSVSSITFLPTNFVKMGILAAAENSESFSLSDHCSHPFFHPAAAPSPNFACTSSASWISLLFPFPLGLPIFCFPMWLPAAKDGQLYQ